MRALPLALLGLVVGLVGVALLIEAGGAAAVVGGVLAVVGWAAYWVATFRLILARVRRGR